MTIKGILFDKDGTLFDYHRTWMPLNHLAAKQAANEDEALARTLMLVGGWHPETDTVGAGSLFAVNSNREIAEAWSEHVNDKSVDDLTFLLNNVFTHGGAETAAPVTNLPSCLQGFLNRDLKLGVATSDSESGAHAMLGHFGVDHLMSYIAGFDSGHGVKPDAGMVHGFCQATGLKVSEVMMVGDNLHDIELGRNAQVGCCVGVLTGTSDRSVLEPEADYVLDDITGIPALLDQLGGTTV